MCPFESEEPGRCSGRDALVLVVERPSRSSDHPVELGLVLLL